MSARKAKRARPPALDATVSTVAAPGQGKPWGLFVLADGTLLAYAGHSIRVFMLAPSGLVPSNSDRILLRNSPERTAGRELNKRVRA